VESGGRKPGYGRAYRIGQKKNVKIYRFITKSTFEEKINVMPERKKKLA